MLPEALTAPEIYPGQPAVELHETHASWVFLAGGYAYKVKKPVRLEFLDYSTLERRHAACREELRVNRELAPGIYVDVQAIVARDGGLRFAPEDACDAVEYALRMHRFDEAQTLHGAIRARSLTPEQIAAVAQRVAEFHRDAQTVPGGAPAEVLRMWSRNVEELARLAHPPDWTVREMRAFGEAFVQAHARELQRRVEDRRIRDVHGDLRCEHVLLGQPVRILDRIEFDPTLRRMDVACDLAFLTADLEAHRRRAAARQLIVAYRHAGGSPGSEPLRAFYAAYWSLVRAKVALIAAGERSGRAAARERSRSKRLWRQAERLCWRARLPLVIVVCGPAASGKSTLAARLGRAADLPVLSSDAIRKHRAGLPATARARPEHYTREFTRAVYEQLGRQALTELDRRGGAIVDATCQRRTQRALLLRRLLARHAPLLVVRCRVSLEVALARVSARMQGAERISDATPEIVQRQFRRFQELDELPPHSVLALDAEQPIDAQLAQVAAAVDARARTAPSA